MAKQYKVVKAASGVEVGQVVTEADLKDKNPGFDKLLRGGSIVEWDGKTEEDPRSPELAAGDNKDSGEVERVSRAPRKAAAKE